MIRAYVAGPYRAPNHWEIAQNIRYAEKLALRLWREGLAVYCPHANTAHFQGAEPDEVWLEGHLEWMRLADVVVVLLNGESSLGTVAEVQEALRLKIPVFWETGEEITGVVHDDNTGAPAFWCSHANRGEHLWSWIQKRREAPTPPVTVPAPAPGDAASPSPRGHRAPRLR